MPTIFNIKKKELFFCGFLGFVPMFFVWNTIGAGLNEYIKQAQNFNLINLFLNKEIYMPIIFFILIIIISIIIKKRVFD